MKFGRGTISAGLFGLLAAGGGTFYAHMERTKDASTIYQPGDPNKICEIRTVRQEAFPAEPAIGLSFRVPAPPRTIVVTVPCPPLPANG